MSEHRPSASVVASAARAIDGAVSRAVRGVNSVSWNPAAVEQFRAVRDKTLGILGQVTGEQAAWSPRMGTWSIAQIADHLLRSEDMYRGQFRRLLQIARDGRISSLEISLKEVDVGFASLPRQVVPLLELPLRMANLFVPHVLREAMVRHPVVAALTPQQSAPREGLSLEKLKHDLAAAIAATEEFFRSPLPPNIDQVTINHPVIGNNTIPQLLGIITAHEQRHQEQMLRLLAHPAFPKSPREPMAATDLSRLR